MQVLDGKKSCDHVAAALHEKKHYHMSWIMVQSSHHRVLVEADCEVLCPLLEIFEPLVLHLEINPLFPPPVVAWLISTSKVAKEIHGGSGNVAMYSVCFQPQTMEFGEYVTIWEFGSYSWNGACSHAGNPKLPSNLYSSVLSSLRQHWFAGCPSNSWP